MSGLADMGDRYLSDRDHSAGEKVMPLTRGFNALKKSQREE
jgi:hypothetical protein